MSRINVTEDDLQSVEFYLIEARNHGLIVEVVAWALKFMKQDSSICIQEAMALASSEWIK
jgi:hypothetical protein